MIVCPCELEWNTIVIEFLQHINHLVLQTIWPGSCDHMTLFDYMIVYKWLGLRSSLGPHQTVWLYLSGLLSNNNPYEVTLATLMLSVHYTIQITVMDIITNVSKRICFHHKSTKWHWRNAELHLYLHPTHSWCLLFQHDN